jgi:MoaA/NifB/PqqE/SkfB family radical SAM enzyme
MGKKPPLVWGYRWDQDLIQRARKLKKLLRISLAIKGGDLPKPCNLKCIFCFTERGSQSDIDNEVQNAEIIPFLKKASSFALDKNNLCYFIVSESEPSLNTGIITVLGNISKLGGYITIFTNLYVLSNDLIETYTSLKNIFVCGKMYGVNKKTTDYLTGVNGSHDVMMRNVLELERLGLAREGRLGVQCVVTSVNQNEILPLFKWCRSRDIIPHIMMYRSQGLGKTRKELIVPHDKLLEIFKRCADYDKEMYGYEWTPSLPMLGIETCYIPGVNIYLRGNGDIHVCAGDNRVIGNFRQNTLEEIINNPILEELRDNFKKCLWIQN